MFRMHEADSATSSAPYNSASRLPRVLGAAKQVLRDEELYMHHSKINMKAAIEGTVWPWHQDFGQWYLDGIRHPDLVTFIIMLDEATEIRGCLNFQPGSHRRGIIEPYWDESTAYKLWAVPPRPSAKIARGRWRTSFDHRKTWGRCIIPLQSVACLWAKPFRDRPLANMFLFQ